MYAAWEIGVWKVLREHFTPDFIVGASAGAWNGWAIAGGATAEELVREWLDPSTATLMRSGPLHAKARHLFDCYQPRVPFALTVVEAPRLRSQIVRGPEIGWQHLAATCSIPAVFPPVRIEGKLYVDGGFRGALPLWAAEEMGATRAIAINCLTTWHLSHGARRDVRASPTARLGRVLEVIRDRTIHSRWARSATRFRWSAANIEALRSRSENCGSRKRALASITM